ncbi:hypothetical protein DUNSADRAFT_17516 [Dunaliella salina]|uniref:Encoded protein n=1 Tax=Dunaliella salina TaxID=3046 RepID=A0ABQ7GZY7_DUNSA|nr:hypothetical protein DUNSADRAFT_17516 [Dunaliella salina]|eukprot:KAF5840169.1 hypothetical protein DUNSADRAFT_17516 [Dunaliella salina]
MIHYPLNTLKSKIRKPCQWAQHPWDPCFELMASMHFCEDERGLIPTEATGRAKNKKLAEAPAVTSPGTWKR